MVAPLGVKTLAQFIPIIADGLGKSQNAISLSGATLNNRIIDFINWGQERIAREYNFDELTLLYTNNYTIEGQLSYPIIASTGGGFGLTQIKDFETIRIIDDQNSIKLEKFHVRKFDQKFPFPQNFAQQSPRLYTTRGMNVELFRIPDAAYQLYITCYNWATPFVSTNLTQTSDFYFKDQLIITAAILEGYLHFAEYDQVKIWIDIFNLRLKDAIRAEGDADWEPHASEFKSNKGGYQSGEPWLDPYATATDPLYGYAG